MDSPAVPSLRIHLQGRPGRQGCMWGTVFCNPRTLTDLSPGRKRRSLFPTNPQVSLPDFKKASPPMVSLLTTRNVSVPQA